MNPLDDLKAAVTAQHDLIAQLKRDADQCQKDIEDARTAWVHARQALLNRIASTWAAPSEAERSQLDGAIESRRAELDSREEAARAVDTRLKQANDRLSNMRQTWDPILGPFPTGDT